VGRAGRGRPLGEATEAEIAWAEQQGQEGPAPSISTPVSSFSPGRRGAWSQHASPRAVHPLPAGFVDYPAAAPTHALTGLHLERISGAVAESAGTAPTGAADPLSDAQLMDPLDAPPVDRPSALSLLLSTTQAAMWAAVPLLGALPQGIVVSTAYAKSGLLEARGGADAVLSRNALFVFAVAVAGAIVAIGVYAALSGSAAQSWSQFTTLWAALTGLPPPPRAKPVPLPTTGAPGTKRPTRGKPGSASARQSQRPWWLSLQGWGGPSAVPPVGAVSMAPGMMMPPGVGASGPSASMPGADGSPGKVMWLPPPPPMMPPPPLLKRSNFTPLQPTIRPGFAPPVFVPGARNVGPNAMNMPAPMPVMAADTAGDYRQAGPSAPPPVPGSPGPQRQPPVPMPMPGMMPGMMPMPMMPGMMMPGMMPPPMPGMMMPGMPGMMSMGPGMMMPPMPMPGSPGVGMGMMGGPGMMPPPGSAGVIVSAPSPAPGSPGEGGSGRVRGRQGGRVVPVVGSNGGAQ